MTAIGHSRFRLARFYITFRCNARCGYCNVWQDPVFFDHAELAPDDLRRSLDQVRDLGVSTVDFTGGEPALYRHLSVAVRHAKAIGLAVELTTNAIRFARQADDLVPYTDTFNISLDTLSAERYHAIRGTDTLDRTITLVERLRQQHPSANLKLITVVSRESLTGLDDIVAFAQSNEVPVYLAPMFEYFAQQREVRDPTRTARSLRITPVNTSRAVEGGAVVPVGVPRRSTEEVKVLTRAVRERVHAPYTIVNLAFLRHIETLDPTTGTACGAGSRILTIGPDGGMLLPCYHEWDTSLRWDRPYRDLVQDPTYLRFRDEEVGLRHACRSCSVFPYLGLPMSYRLTVDFLMQAVSEEITKIKSVLQQGPPGVATYQRDDLAEPLHRLLAAIGTLSLRPGTHLDELYHFQAGTGGGVATDLTATAMPVEELLADHAHEDCWRAQRTPHRLARLLYTDIVPALVACARSAASPRAAPLAPKAAPLAAKALGAHLALWAAWLQRCAPASGADLDGAARAQISRWCEAAGGLLSATGYRDAARSSAVIGAFFDVPTHRLRSWGGLAGHADELYLAAALRGVHASRRQADLAPCFTPAVVAALTHPSNRPADTSPDSCPDLARAARGDRLALAGLRAYATRLCRTGDTGGLRDLVRRWKVAAAHGNPTALERLLLGALLGVPTPRQAS